MANIANFKEFVKKNPILIKYVNNNEVTWQHFYEMYDLYGEENEVWNKYLNEEEKQDIKKGSNSKSSFSDVLNMVKKMDADKVQEGINSLQKALGLFGDLIVKKDAPVNTNSYTPRQVYKRFED